MISPTLRLATGILLACFLLGTAQAAESPSDSVRQLNDALLRAMRDAKALGFEGRYKLLSPVLTRVFALRDMARVSVGRTWETLDKSQRARLIEKFTQVSIATFAARFDGYAGERFEILGERPALRGAILVKNQIVKALGDIVPIYYLLRQFDGKWRVVDIYLKATYSEIAIKRSQYRSIIKREGFEGLLQKLRDKVGQLKSGTDT